MITSAGAAAGAGAAIAGRAKMAAAPAASSERRLRCGGALRGMVSGCLRERRNVPERRALRKR